MSIWNPDACRFKSKPVWKWSRFGMGSGIWKLNHSKSGQMFAILQETIPNLNKNIWILNGWGHSYVPTHLRSGLQKIWILDPRRNNKMNILDRIHNTSMNWFLTIKFFLMLALIRRAFFWPLSMVYISVIITHICYSSMTYNL